MRHIAAFFVLFMGLMIITACDSTNRLSDSQRLLIVCESWESIFARIDSRDSFGVASQAEIDAVDTALPLLNPICTGDPTTATAFDIRALENALLAVIVAEGKRS